MTALEMIGATMTAAFGHRWTSAHGDDFANTSGSLWAIELAGMSRGQIERGLQVAVRSSDGWPPVLADFRAACLGVMQFAEVDAMLARPPKEWLPFASLVKRNIDDHAWRMSGPDGQQHLLRRGYDRARAHVMAGGKLPEYTPTSAQIVHQEEENPLPPIMFSSQDAIEEIRRSFGQKPEAVRVAEKDLKPLISTDPCIRCGGTRQDPDAPPGVPTDCQACYGSGVERAYNVKYNPDGSVRGGGLT